MYAPNALPILLTLPLAFYIHSRTCIESLLQFTNPASESSDISLQPTHYDMENANFNQLMMERFGNRLEMVDMSPTYFPMNRITRSIYTLYYYYAPTFSESFVQALWFHVVATIITTLIIRQTLVGVLVKIFARRTKQTILLVPSIPSLIREKIKNRILVPVSDQSETESSDEEFVECSSLLDRLKVEREESIPKTNEAEEKFVQTESTSNSDQGTGPESVITRMVSTSDNYTECALMTSTPRDDAKFIPFDESLLEEGIRRTVPKKLKKFLERKHDDSMRLGISFDDDGYLHEEDEEVNKYDEFDRKVHSFDHSFAENIQESIWSRLNVFT